MDSIQVERLIRNWWEQNKERYRYHPPTNPSQWPSDRVRVCAYCSETQDLLWNEIEWICWECKKEEIMTEGLIWIDITQEIAVMYNPNMQRIRLLKNGETVDEIEVEATYTLKEFSDYVENIRTSLRGDIVRT